MSRILAIVGGVLAINGFFMCVLSNLNIGSLMTIFAGVLLLLYGVFYTKIKKYTVCFVQTVYKNNYLFF